MTISKSFSDIDLCLDDIKDEEVVELLKEHDIDEISVNIEDVDVDVELGDFDEDDLIEYLEDKGYEVFDSDSRTHADVLPSSFDVAMDHIESIKDLLQRHCYDSSFIRLLLEEITRMPMGSKVDDVLAALKKMCE